MRRFLLSCVLLAGCGYTQPVPAGEGRLADAAKTRIKDDAASAFFTRVAQKASYAAANPSDERANREAVELTRQAVRLVRYSKDEGAPPPDVLVTQVQGAVKNLAALGTSCATNLEVAKMYVEAQMREAAFDKYTDSMDRCGSVRALRDGAYTYERLGRCDDLQPHAVAIWPHAASDEQIDVLDAVAICSTPVNLRPNLLAFASPSVVGDYLALLDARARKRAREECRSSCWAAYDSCNYGCWGGSCGGCEQTRALCEASCR